MDFHFGDLNGKEFQCSGRGWGGGRGAGAETGRGITLHPARMCLTISLDHFLRKTPQLLLLIRDATAGPEQPGVTLIWLLSGS